MLREVENALLFYIRSGEYPSLTLTESAVPL